MEERRSGDPVGVRAQALAQTVRTILVAAFLAAAAPALACDSPGEGYTRLESGRFVVWLATEPRAPGVGREFALALKVCAKGPDPVQALRADAWMPAHRHGMNTRASTVDLGAGRYRVDGLLYHMPGRWALRLEIDSADRRDRLALEQDVE